MMVVSGASRVDKSDRIFRSASIVLNGPIEDIFPLFGPIREMEWAEGWCPEVLYGDSVLEERMIFRTPTSYTDESFYTWVISKYSPDKSLIEYTVSSLDRIWFVHVQAKKENDKTKATITYTYTSFSALAKRKNEESLSKIFIADLKDWEEAINYYFATGKKLKT